MPLLTGEKEYRTEHCLYNGNDEAPMNHELRQLR